MSSAGQVWPAGQGLRDADLGLLKPSSILLRLPSSYSYRATARALQQQQQAAPPAASLPPPVEVPIVAPAPEVVTEEVSGATTWQYDPNEPRYCVCNDVSYGDMVGCDNDDVSRWLSFLRILKTLEVVVVFIYRA